MGGPGSGRKGGARDAKGQFTIEGAIAITTAEAVADVEKLEGKVDELTGATDRNSTALDKNTQEMDDNTDSKKKNTSETGDAVAGLDTYAISLQIATSALNQTTGALNKMIGGLAETRFLSEETAQDWQKNVRILEFFTGAMELALAVTLLLNFAGYTLSGAATAMAGGFTAAATSISAAAVASWAFMAPWIPLIILVTAFVAAIYLIATNLDGLAKLLDIVANGFKKLAIGIEEVFGFTTGLTSSVTGLGDALTDNPVTKMISKAGGAIF